MQSENDDEASVINSNEWDIYTAQKELEYISNSATHPNSDKLSESNSVEIVVNTINVNLPVNKMETSQLTPREKMVKKSHCQKNCSGRGVRIFYWIGMILIVASIFGLYFSTVNLYEPSIHNYHQAICQVNQCISSDILLTCCNGDGITRQCTTKFYTSLNFTLTINQTISYTKKEVYDCYGPIGQNSWEYPGMCDDPLLENINCYYDERDIYNSLHLTNAYQYSVEVIIAISVICIFVYMIVFWSIYSFVYCACFRQFY